MLPHNPLLTVAFAGALTVIVVWSLAQLLRWALNRESE